MAQKWPEMTQNGPNMTQNGPRMTQNAPKIARTFFAIFFLLKRRYRKLFSLLECMLASSGLNGFWVD